MRRAESRLREIFSHSRCCLRVCCFLRWLDEKSCFHHLHLATLSQLLFLERKAQQVEQNDKDDVSLYLKRIFRTTLKQWQTQYPHTIAWWETIHKFSSCRRALVCVCVRRIFSTCLTLHASSSNIAEHLYEICWFDVNVELNELTQNITITIELISALILPIFYG